MDIDALTESLHAVGQEQVLRFLDDLSADTRRNLIDQLAVIDLTQLAELVESHVRKAPSLTLPGDIRPPEIFPRKADASRRALYYRAETHGRQLLKQGKIGAFLVAGGQGTRLGYDGPKGEFPVTPIRRKPLFQVFAEQLRATAAEFGKPIPWYIMTSDVNDGPTRDFFAKHDHFGYDPQDIFFFRQGMMPAFSMDGKILLAEKGSLALSPDGHGGSLRALAKSGALDDMTKRGIQHLSYFQVDNPLVRCIDPLFLGLHDITGCEMASKMVPKSGPLERVGNFAMVKGVLQVIEYSDLPEELAQQTREDGSLRFNAGSIAIHALSVAFIRRLNTGGRLQLPWHRAQKKVPYIDDRGEMVTPDQPNAIKLEQFVFDAIPLAKNALVYETDRAEEFSPVKNAQGADSPVTCRQDQIRRAARWLAEAGISIPMKGDEPDVMLEISPLRANSVEQLKANPPTLNLNPGESVYVE